jgi:hypothetical protein
MRLGKESGWLSRYPAQCKTFARGSEYVAAREEEAPRHTINSICCSKDRKRLTPKGWFDPQPSNRCTALTFLYLGKGGGGVGMQS